MGVLLDHVLHAQDLLKNHALAIDYFGDYLSGSSYFRQDRANGWQESSEVARESYPTQANAEKPLVYALNKPHALLRQLAQKFLKLLEKPEGFDAMGREFGEKVLLYRAFVSENYTIDPILLGEDQRLSEYHKQIQDCSELITDIRDLFRPEKLPEITLKVGDKTVTISNKDILNPQLPESYPAIALFCAGRSGIVMLDRVKIPKDIIDFMSGVIRNEADITFILDALLNKTIANNPSLNTQDFPKLDLEDLIKPMKEGVDTLALNYHFHRTLGSATPDSIEAIRRFHWFAAGEPEPHEIPFSITSKTEAGIALYALAKRIEKESETGTDSVRRLLQYAELLATGREKNSGIKWMVEKDIANAESSRIGEIYDSARALTRYFASERAQANTPPR